MKRILILAVTVVLNFCLFAKDAHKCSEYQATFDNPLSTVQFIPDWFEHLELADNNIAYGYDEEFLREHSGRAGKLIVQSLEGDCIYENDESDDINIDCYWVLCSGTLIGNHYFITAGHCAEAEVPVKNVGVLFGYQKADLENSDDGEYGDDDEISDDDSDNLEYPRVSLHGYLDETGNYRQYGLGGYSNFKKHPAYFPIIGDSCNPDGSVEKGWGDVCWIQDGIKKHRTVEKTMWHDKDSFPFFRLLGKIDYAIYKLNTNNDVFYPENTEDPWPWRSENNQDSQNSLLPNLVMPWQLPDNTNGKRGWARVNTAVLQKNTHLDIIGSPGFAKITSVDGKIGGLKVVNSGSVVDGKGFGKGKENDHYEDILIFDGADIQKGHSGSSVIDDSGRLAGVVSWIGCKPGNNWVSNAALNKAATNYATPMWEICRASQIIKDAARDQDCNGQIDWWDFIERLLNLSKIIKIGDIQFWDLDFSSSTSEVQNYRYDVTQQKVITETREIPAYTYQVAWSDNGDFFYVVKQAGVFYLFKNGTSLGTISNYPQLIGSITLVKGNDIYLAGGNLTGVSDYFPGSGNNGFVPYITKISSDGQNGYSFSIVADLPSDFEDIRIFSLGNDIYVSGNTNNSFVIYELVPNNQGGNPYTLSLVSDTSQPVRKDYNLTAADGKIIVSGGATDNITNIVDLEESQYDPNFSVYGNIIMLEPTVSPNWVTVAENINDKVIMLSVTAIDDGKLVVVNPFITVGNSMQKIVMDLSDIPINGENLRVEFEFEPVVYCLGESESTISGGLTINSQCVSFAHPFYNSFSAGTTVYSVAGKDDRLYAGTNDSIKIYDIPDPNSPVLVSSFSTNNARVNDLEIEGDVLFAATSKGLYKLDASDPDELDQILFVSTGSTSQNEIELYDGKVYVGDDNGIKIRDKETLSVLLSANSGQVYDFAIENGEIAMFRSSFWNSGIQFRNAETLVETAYDYTSCNNVEVENFNGRLYLACDNYNYSFEANNGYIYFTQLSGDKRDLRENYTYNGYTYTPDGNYIRLSTNEEVPAICGNGIVEGDEVCDGTPIDCADLDESYVSGIAACNQTCDGYVLDNCTAGNGGDGWN